MHHKVVHSEPVLGKVLSRLFLRPLTPFTFLFLNKKAP